MKILLQISFLGTRYAGYQVQKGHATVQGALCEAAEKVFGVKCDITGCSRTDSGVHANAFYATVSEHGKCGLETTIPTEKIPFAFVSALPEDISVISAERVGDSFHARYDVKYKEYIYKIYNRPIPNPFYADRSLHYPRAIDEKALSRMREGAKKFVGTYDFSSYMASGSDIKDTVRTVFDADVTREGDFIIFKVSANGFLYNMVRIFTGTLLGVAEGKTEPEDIIKITEARDRRLSGITAPAKGLYLNRVVYREGAK